MSGPRDPLRRRGRCVPARGADVVLDARPQAQPGADRRRPAARERRADARRGGRPARRDAASGRAPRSSRPRPSAPTSAASRATARHTPTRRSAWRSPPRASRCSSSRCSHKSVAAGLVLSGARPVWVAPAVDEARGVALGHPLEAIEAALEAEPDARAVLLVEPSWLGVVSQVERIAELAHARGIPLICDQAWAGHFGFHPDVPASALALGADAVAISTHKALTSFTPARCCSRATRGYLDLGRLDAAFDVARDDEPVGQPVRLDRPHARADAGARPRAAHARARARGAGARADRRASTACQMLDDGVARRSVRRRARSAQADRGRQRDAGRRHRGRPLANERGIRLEGADRRTLVPLLTIGDDEARVRHLATALAEAIDEHRGEPAARRRASRPRGARCTSRP